MNLFGACQRQLVDQLLIDTGQQGRLLALLYEQFSRFAQSADDARNLPAMAERETTDDGFPANQTFQLPIFPAHSANVSLTAVCNQEIDKTAIIRKF